MRTQFILSTCLALAAAAVHAQETPTPLITPPPAPLVAPVPSNEPEIPLEELIRRAQNNSPRLVIARENLEAARQRAGAAGALAGPTLQLVPGLGGTAEARDEEVILAQPLDLFGLRHARRRVSAAETRRAEAENLLTGRSLTIEVRNAAALLFAAQEAENLEQMQVQVAQLFRDAAARRATLGDVPPVQVQRAELELLRLQNDLARARAERLTQRAALNLLIGTEPDAPLRVALPLDAGAIAPLPLRLSEGTQATAATPPASQPAPATSETAGGEAVARETVAPEAIAPETNLLATRPDLQSAQATLEARQAEVQALGRERLPAVELQARRSSFFGRAGSYALRAVVTVPLFDFGANRGQSRAAEAEVRAQQATVRLLGQQAAVQVERARAQLQSRRETVTRYREQLLPLTLDLLRKTQIGYDQGASTYLEVLEAQRTLRQVQTEYLQALVGVQTGETALDAALNGGAFTFDDQLENSTLRGAAR